MKRYRQICNTILFSVSITISGAIWAAEMENPWNFLPATVAEIAGRKISRDELIRQINLPDAKAATATPSELLRLAKIALKQQVEKYLISRLMARDGFSPSDPRIAKEYSTIFSSYSAGERKRFLKKLGLERNSLAEDGRKLPRHPEEKFRLAFTLWLRRKILDTPVTAAELERFYREHQDRFLRPAGVKISSICLSYRSKAERHKARKLAETVHALLLQGVSFEQVKKQYQSLTGHWQGNFIRGKLPPQLDREAFALREGEISRVIALPNEFVIIRLDKKVEAGYIPLNTIKRGLKLELQRAKALKWFREAMGKEREQLRFTSYL